MPEHIRALLVLLVVSTFVWVLVRPAIVQIIAPETFARWRLLWYFTTFAWFLSFSFWIYVIVMTVMLLMVGRREPRMLGLYFLLLLAAPPSGAAIPGFGILDHFFVLNHFRLLALALLLPYAWRLSMRSSTIRFFQSPVDWMVFGYLVLNTALAFRENNFTNDFRAALMLWIDLFLPYYVASRSLQDKEDFRHALAGLAIGGVLLSVIAAVEVLRSWKLYEAAASALGVGNFGAYKPRGNFIRPAGTVVYSIVLGYVVAAALGAYLYLQGLIDGRVRRWLGWLALSMGVLASLSRGPWVGAVLLVLVFVLMGRKPIKRLMVSAAVSACMLVGLSTFQTGQQIINLLPFIGHAEQDNVDYRADLLTVSMAVIERNLFFGSADHLDAPELQVMRQGEGIIDIVNSYLGVTLYAGIVGLILFSGMFLWSLVLIRRGMRWSRVAEDPDGWQLGRALFATMVSAMFIIFTVSAVSIVPVLNFTLLGISCAYFFSQRAAGRAIQAAARA